MNIKLFSKWLGTETTKRTFLVNYNYENIDIPVRIYVENRPNVRVSFGQQNVILRLPYGISRTQIQKHLEWAYQWIDKQLQNQPALLQRFSFSDYQDGQNYRINGDSFILKIFPENRKSFAAIMKDNHLLIKTPEGLDINDRNQGIKRVLSRFFSNFYLGTVEKRIDELNDKYFQEEIQFIRIKYNKSNWGSCSAKRNINISSRLLFAPNDVQDYVFVHELTHLKELNHSPRFWQIVEQIVPDYRAKEKWLKSNSHRLDF